MEKTMTLNSLFRLFNLLLEFEECYGFICTREAIEKVKMAIQERIDAQKGE